MSWHQMNSFVKHSEHLFNFKKGFIFCLLSFLLEVSMQLSLHFLSFCLKKLKILGMTETKIQSKGKKMTVNIVFIVILIAFCYIHVFLQCLNTYKDFIFLFLNLLAFVNIFNAVYFKCNIGCTLLYAYLFNKFLHNQFRGSIFCHFRNLKYI